MVLCYVDNESFRSITGVEYNSKKGFFFRDIAKQSLLCILKESTESDYSRREVIHKLKGIASSCGMLNISRVCIKLESYFFFINIARVDTIINIIITNIINGIG